MLIKVFGPPVLLRDGVPVSGAGTQRRRLALLAALAIGAPPGRAGLSRERLLALLWPEADDERGRAALSQALYAIRRDLGADDAITGSTELRLNPDRVRCDYWEFVQALADGADSAAAALRTAPLLDGFDLPEARAFGFWLEEQRAEVDRRWREATERTAEQAARRGDRDEVVRWRRALANADPLSGRTATGLAQALVEAGEREAALRHLRVHAALVRQELDSEPQEEVTRLAEAIQQGEVAATTPPPSAPAPAARLTPPAATEPPPAVGVEPLSSPATPPAAAPVPPTRRTGVLVGLSALVVIVTAIAIRALDRELALAAPAPELSGAVAASDTAPTTSSPDALRLYREAVRAMADGRRDAAAAQLRGALGADPGFAMAALQLAALLGNDHPDFEPLMRQAMRRTGDVSRREALLIRASWLRHMDDPGVGPLMDTLVTLYPDDLGIRMHAAGPALYQYADFPRARALLEGVWVADSQQVARRGRGRCFACEALAHLLTVHQWADSLPAAERMLRRHLRLAPRDPLAWALLADVLERDERRHDEMRAAIDSAVRHGRPSARTFDISAASRRGDRAGFERALAGVGSPASERDRSEAWSRAILYRNTGDLEAALREARRYRASVGSLPTEAGLTAGTMEAIVLLELGRGREAAAIWDSIARYPRTRSAPSHRARQQVWFRTLAATARFEAGDTTGLAALADSLAVLGPQSGYARDNALHHHVRGLAYVGRGWLEEAVVEFQRGIVFPSMGFTRSNWHLARTLAALGRTDEARRWLEAARRAPRDGSPLYLSQRTIRATLAELDRPASPAGR